MMKKDNPSKIIVRLFGGLGNQLFSYAAARRLAFVSGADLIIDDITGFSNDKIYGRFYQLDHFNIKCRKANYRERLEPFSRVRRILNYKINSYLPLDYRTYIKQEGNDFESKMIYLQPKNSVTHIEGYWQSEGYFMDISDILRDELKIIPPVDVNNQKMAELIRAYKSVAVHIRFFEDKEFLDLDNILVNYYNQAINLIEQLFPESHFFIFSDRPHDVGNFIPLPESRFTLVALNHGDNLAYADLWLMTQCNHFIIANSTFSWWGAWLASSPDKKVIAPGFRQNLRTTAWGFDGLLPSSWIKL
jgi:hypothetical protein